VVRIGGFERQCGGSGGGPCGPCGGGYACGSEPGGACSARGGVDEVLAERDEVERSGGDGGARRRSRAGVGEQQLEGVSLSDGPLVREDEER